MTTIHEIPTDDDYAAIKHYPESRTHHRQAYAIRRGLTRILTTYIETQGWTQTEAAQHLGTNQSQISRVMVGNLHRCSIQQLLKMCSHAGLTYQFTITDPTELALNADDN